ncbi:hypothetical protein COCOBI_01-6730 [Coccomyxa sp. Obi]|nr:hypothetical protein COCOBI_01-6730 [Coccomyxa sp. Obi]
MQYLSRQSNRKRQFAQQVEGIPIPSKGKEARCDADFAWSKDGTKKNYSRHAKGAQLFEKMYHVLEAAKGQALPADSVTTLCGIVKEGLRLCYKAMLLTRVADSSSYEVAEEYLKLSDPDVYTIDIKKLEAAEKAVDRHSSKRVRFEKGRSYQSEYDEDVEESEDDAVESDEDV